VPWGGRRQNEQGEVEREFILMDCSHGEHRVYLKRSDI